MWSAGAELQAVFCSFLSFFAFAFVVGGPVGGVGFEFCVLVAGWGHALQSEWQGLMGLIIISKYS